ncbi:ParB/RepB/Spo0J family partition protein [Blastomonas marina]|uniref:Chromosome partitioning protein ParB n=1 Tax=Blastomonas marina TaxID=1867408 RepID=A0ABQ1FHN3_9SPHN|nr:ParB/RepB/Spo0J family partition protein [Blastomonas marina]WPZ03494.1 ParB/RepB/Spo0J family partition protein [Blastomonas marina]GGA12361.1 chromosome partitioning protein ParB [Blastomonas marina]
MSDSKAKAAPKKRQALGRGLGALIGETKREQAVKPAAANEGAGEEAPVVSSGTSVPEGEGLASLPISQIAPHPDQPRKHFDDEALGELAASIGARGVIQPVIVTREGPRKYRLVAGERRWRAAQKAQLHEIPALIRDLSEREVTALALIENLQREDLNPVDEARAYQRLADDEDMTQAEIAQLVDKSRSHVANFQRLLALPEKVLDALAEEKLSMGHARALIGFDGAEALAKKAIAKGMSVRDVEKAVRREREGDGAEQKAPKEYKGAAGPDSDIRTVEKHLEEFLGMKVKISADRDPKSGTLSIRYSTLDQLDTLCQRLTGGEI